MPEYLAPGVFVEEVSFRQKTIEGVSTSTTGFVGPTRFGPTAGEPALLTSFSEFERIYGGIDPLQFTNDGTNYVAHGVRAYFEEGGKRLYVSRVYSPEDTNDPLSGVSTWAPPESPDPFTVRARYPGRAGDMRVAFVFRLGENIRRQEGSGANARFVLRGVTNFDTVLAEPISSPFVSPPLSPPEPAQIYWVERFFDEALGADSHRLRQDNPEASSPVSLSLDQVSSVRILTVNVLARLPGRFSDEQSWQGLSFHPGHRNSLIDIFTGTPERRSTELYVPLIITTALGNGAEIAATLLGQASLASSGSTARTVLDGVQSWITSGASPGDAALTFRFELTGGADGQDLVASNYEGEEDPKSGLRTFEDLEDISIVAAPGASAEDALGRGVMRFLISHCERMRFRIAVMDSIFNSVPGEVRELRGEIDTTRAALYYPWVRVLDPLSEGEPREIFLPPSGFVSGIYARSDIERGVHKAPANEVVRLANGFEFLINKSQQEALNPEGINCLRFFEGRGFRVWGARTASSDPEWKYVNIRRYFAFLERSIEKGTQWAVFEPNGPVLWANVQRTIEDFLYNEFVSNHLAGRKPAEAYFVRCDETTMTQNDRDNGRLICLVAVAPLYPAEFVIFRIGQKTADSRG